MRIPIETFRLPNGLFVTLSEDHTAPIVAVNLWYHVGSANERAGPHGLRASVRAHALSGLGRRRRERALRARSARRRHAERIDLARSHELLRDRAVEPARARALARGQSHGLAAAGDDAAEARHAARRREERAPLVDGQPAVRHVVGEASGAGVSRGASVPSFAHRLDGGSRCGEPRGHRAVLRDVLHARTTRCFRSPAISTQQRRERSSNKHFGPDPAGQRQAAASRHDAATDLRRMEARSRAKTT